MTVVDAPGGLLAGAVVLGVIHGVEPGHGWPVAAAYAMDRSNTWVAGLVASLLIGVGHLVSSIAVVFAYFYAIAYFDLAQMDDPVVVAGVAIGGPIGIVAGLLLIGLGVREYYVGGHGHVDYDGHGHDRDEHDSEHEPDGAQGSDAETGHEHGDEHDHPHDHGEPDARGWTARLRSALPFVGGHEHLDEETARNNGLLGIVWVAFVLGFAHEEEFEIIALCTGSTHCLELMMAYAVTVVLGIVAFTMLLVAGYQHFEERVERVIPYLPAFSAAVLIAMGSGFVLGVL